VREEAGTPPGVLVRQVREALIRQPWLHRGFTFDALFGTLELSVEWQAQRLTIKAAKRVPERITDTVEGAAQPGRLPVRKWQAICRGTGVVCVGVVCANLSLRDASLTECGSRPFTVRLNIEAFARRIMQVREQFAFPEVHTRSTRARDANMFCFTFTPKPYELPIQLATSRTSADIPSPAQVQDDPKADAG
jgi:hypothetical protein